MLGDKDPGVRDWFADHREPLYIVWGLLIRNQGGLSRLAYSKILPVILIDLLLQIPARYVNTEPTCARIFIRVPGSVRCLDLFEQILVG